MGKMIKNLVVCVGVAVLCSTVIADYGAQLRTLEHGLKDIALSMTDVLGVIENQSGHGNLDYEINSEFAKKYAIELENIMDFKDDFDEMESLFLSINYMTYQKENFPMNVYEDLYIMLLRFEQPNSKFHKIPELVARILFPLSKYVESLMNIIQSKTNNTKFNKNPCRLADIIEVYFSATLFSRLGKIEMLFSDYSKFPWYSKIHEIFEDPFNPDGHAKYNRKLLSCVTSKQLERVMSTCFPDPGGFGGKIFHDYKKVACGEYFEDLSRIEDKFEIKNDVYFGGSDGACIIEYFSLVRYKLETEFGDAYKKLLPFCTPEVHQRYTNKTFTGTGWLTINVIAALPGSKDHSYDLYVKLIVYYPKQTKQYTTKITEKSSGWTPIGELFRFDEAPMDAPIKLQIWSYNKFRFDEKLYEEKTTLSTVIDRIIFENSSMKTNSKLFMVSIWRNHFKYEFRVPDRVWF